MAGLHHDLARICAINGIPVEVDRPQPWLSRSGHLSELVRTAAPGDVIDAIATIHRVLGGDEVRLARHASGTPSAPDLVHTELGCIIEIDELPHFTSVRRSTFARYPAATSLGFDLGQYLEMIDTHYEAADAILAREKPRDFPVPAGRQAQRAYQDALRDLLAPVFTGYPVIRIPVPDHSLSGVLPRLRAAIEALAEPTG
ncbi:MAG: hypothetical protein R2715_13355 [Ilumatobacteraceae bacterium]